MRWAKGCPNRSRASSGGTWVSAALVPHVVVELRDRRAPACRSRSGRAQRSRPRIGFPAARAGGRVGRLSRRDWHPALGDVEVESRRDVVGALLEHAAGRDVDGAERGREVVDPQVAVRRCGAAGPNLEIEAAHDIGRELRVGEGEAPHAALAVEGHRAAVVGEDHVSAAGHRRMSHVERARPHLLERRGARATRGRPPGRPRRPPLAGSTARTASGVLAYVRIGRKAELGAGRRPRQRERARAEGEGHLLGRSRDLPGERVDADVCALADAVGRAGRRAPPPSFEGHESRASARAASPGSRLPGSPADVGAGDEGRAGSGPPLRPVLFRAEAR